MGYTYGSTAKCKVANGQTRSEYEVRLGYQVNSQDIANNTSNITLRLEVRSINSSYRTYGYNQTTTIDGSKLGSKTFDMRNTNTWQVFGEKTITVTHDSKGSYSSTKSGSFSTTTSSGYSLKSGSANVTVKPATIARYATSNQSLKSKTSNSVVINWSSDSTIDGIWYSINNGSTWNWVIDPRAKSGSYTILGLSANSTYNIKTRVKRLDSQLTTDSSSLSVTTYAKTIPTINVSSKTINSITVNSGCNVNVSSTQYRIKTSNSSYGNYQTSATFSDLSPNTTYIVEVKKIATDSEEAGTATITVTTYNYATLSSAPNFNLGSSEAIIYSNPSSQNIAVSIYATNGASMLAPYRTANGTSYTFNFTDVELDRIYKRFENDNSMKVRIYIKTTCNNKNYESYKEVTVTLNGNQKTAHVGVDNIQKRAKVFVGVNGTVKRAVLWIGNDGRKRCI